jgi:hypothetical protein
MDIDGYPEEDELEKIRTWNCQDLHGLMQYVHGRWMFADSGYFKQEDDVYYLSTAGWSGNEEIIGAMKQNYVWWSLFWEQSNRGGHHIFCKYI